MSSRYISISTKVNTGFVILFVMGLISLVLYYRSSQLAVTEMELTANSRVPTVILSSSAHIQLLSMKSNLLGYLATNVPSYNEEYRVARENFEQQLNELKQISRNDFKLKVQIDELEALYLETTPEIQNLFDLNSKPLENEPAIGLTRLKLVPRFNSIQQNIKQLQSKQKANSPEAESSKPALFLSSITALTETIKRFATTHEIHLKPIYGKQLIKSSKLLSELRADAELANMGQKELKAIVKDYRAMQRVVHEIMMIIETDKSHMDLYLYKSHVSNDIKAMLSLLQQVGAGQQEQLESGLTRAVSKLSKTILQAILIVVLVLLVILFFSYIYHRIISRPIRNLKKRVDVFAGGDYSTLAEIVSNDELGQLALSFNSLASQLDASNQKTQRYLQEILKAKEKAEHSDRAKSDFLANMSHEIRTPMNVILGFAEILHEQEREPRKLRFIDSMFSSGKALLSLINDILDLSKIEAGKFDLIYKPLKLDSFFNELMVIFSQKATDKGVFIETIISPSVPRTLILDETRLRQVLINLISNALKFTTRGTIKLKVELVESDAPQGSASIRISVEDSGIGIPEEKLETIFEPFEQVKGDKVRQSEGTGLGLTITKRLVEVMRGTISVQSQPDQGSTFRVFLPEVEIAAHPAAAETQTQSVNLNSVVFERATILIVDDIDYNREILRTFLSSYNFEFYEATNGQEALDVIYQQQPDLVLLDMKMPIMSGYEVIERLNSEHSAPHSKIVAVTASALLSDEKKITELCDGYLRKPVRKAGLISKLMEFLPYCEQKEQTAPLAISTAQSTEDLTSISPELVNKLRTAAEGGFISQLIEYIDQLAADFPLFAAELQAHAEKYEHEVIVEELNKRTRPQVAEDAGA